MSFRPSPRLCKSLSASSKRWLERQYNDPFVRQRLSHPANYRSRSAFKLLELDSYKGSSFLTKPDVRAVVDLGAAPGGWSQVVAGKFGYLPDPKSARPPPKPEGAQDPARVYDRTIVALDLLPVAPIPGVRTLRMDFLSPEAEGAIKALLSDARNPDGRADVVLSDMAANATGNRARDVEASLQICEAALEFCRRNLRTAESVGRNAGGVLVIKYFDHPYLTEFRKEQLEPAFNRVRISKPKSSRSDSSEAYWVCLGFRGARE
ncbi:ribosomal RNA large subunit methyltransferase J [Punctularia strigosozonata HHB-11173 SS5]|uniref:rRNA methyltransferase 2, mitochondrial n=1 Tax=Punctularia strigosozonata (strain HHB-11173) TaxID=741275 RepID=R7S2S8_PUNST|nr:ribosomal RNA large subunit methyltransferase J [Punctularia strigosozonata HHB-11173 SS5]EIN04097.1 ribosomal RNA large subunit methyltransferase J [Punctularia strigosozonata HHB-11173 SS5]